MKQTLLMKRFAVATVAVIMSTMLFFSCERQPILHLHEGTPWDINLPIIDLNLKVYWNYGINYRVDYDLDYDWEDEWYYGWDDTDRELFGEIGYEEPASFCLRRYYTAKVPYAPHTEVQRHTFSGKSFTAKYSWGYWDLLAWNDITTIDGIQSLIFDEETTLDSVIAYTNQTMHSSRYQAPKYTRSFYQPEQLFAGYDQAEEINRDLIGFVWDEERQAYVKDIDLTLEPATYIYLTQVIIHHNRGRITGCDGNGNLSGMARSVNLNTGVSGTDPITVHYSVRYKTGCKKLDESVDIIGGRLLSFGMCGVNPNRIPKTQKSYDDGMRHYLDVDMQFNNGYDSTFVFDVTDQVRQRYKGGVITVELDADNIDIPSRTGGSGFDAVVEDYDEETHEFDIGDGSKAKARRRSSRK